MAKQRLLFIFIFIFLVPGLASSGDFKFSQEKMVETPEVLITPPPSYKAKKIALFPLEMPAIAFKIATLPIGVALKTMQEKHTLDKAMDLLSNKERTFWVYPVIEGGAGSGFGGGIGIRHTDLFHKRYLLGATYRIHINMTQNASASFGKPEAFMLFGEPVSYSTGIDWDRSLSNYFYGIGNGSSKNDLADYSNNTIKAGLTFGFEPCDKVSISPHIGIISGSTSAGGNDTGHPSVQEIFPASELPGFNRWLDYIVLGLRAAHDSRDNVDSPTSGGLRSLSFKRYQGFNTAGYSYNEYEVDIRQYIRLFMPRQALVLRTDWVFQQTTGNDLVPFSNLAVLDVGSPLRGFPQGRFHDRNSLLFNFEYRYPVWSIVDGVIFYDTGRVYHTVSDISLAHIKYSAGLGLNMRIPNLMLFHFYAAYGGEGVNFVFGASKPI